MVLTLGLPSALRTPPPFSLSSPWLFGLVLLSGPCWLPPPSQMMRSTVRLASPQQLPCSLVVAWLLSRA
eukprot:6271174-Prorocentrum_lima.AAC.1